ncbi:hypothetical protein FH972_019179 [Carpinus fangiana]|uniref:DUF1421 domain-containing protein n=1 Tax=Carpinus fangiana TaxID=176857 RepID=A0A5N6RPH1_9ROSI|nr:hypothetical protein FH972_019179 [Carpinus fangiana]
MRTSEFTDKQIMELSGSRSENSSALFSNLQDDDENDDDLSPVFRFHPIRPVVFSKSVDSAEAGDSHVAALIDRKMNEFGEILLHAVEGLSARLSQLETRTRRLESSIDDLKDSVEFNHGRSDGKLRELEIVLREAHGGIQDLRDKQEIADAQLQLAKLQMLKNLNSTVQSNSAQGMLSSVPLQSHQPLPIPVACPQPSNVPANVTLQTASTAASATPIRLPTMSSQNQIPSLPHPESYYSPPESTHQQYHMPPTHQYSQQPFPAPHNHYHPAPQLPPITQSTQQPPQLHPPVSFGNPQAYFPSSHRAPATAPSSQNFYLGSAHQVHDQPSSNPYSGLPSRHSQQPPGHSSFYDHSYSGSPSRYSSSTVKPLQPSLSPSVFSGGSSNSRLPTAQVLPHALPMASSVDGGSGSGGTGDGIPRTDDVVDKVVAMGFRRDLVRATVRKLTETGQPVDLNVVLDRLMNNGEVEPQSGRFGR